MTPDEIRGAYWRGQALRGEQSPAALSSASATEAALRAEVERLKWERATCDGSCDIALARRQVGPDGNVPGNAKECAHLWEQEAHRLETERRELESREVALRGERDEARRLLAHFKDGGGRPYATLCPVCGKPTPVQLGFDGCWYDGPTCHESHDIETRAEAAEKERDEACVALGLMLGTYEAFVDAHGGGGLGIDHLDGCPEDDTCECPLYVLARKAEAAARAVLSRSETSQRAGEDGGRAETKPAGARSEPIASASSPPASTGERGGDALAYVRDQYAVRTRLAGEMGGHTYDNGWRDALLAVGLILGEDVSQPASGERSPRAGTAEVVSRQPGEWWCGRIAGYVEGAPCPECGDRSGHAGWIGPGLFDPPAAAPAPSPPAPVAGAVSGQGGET